MSTLGTFESFTTMRLGIYAAQQGLRVTGNNVANINTVGYTRQRVDQISFKAGGSDRYASMIDKRVGNGVLISGINQIRDPFLDIRYRNASNDTYHLDTWLSGLRDIATILDEVGKGDNDGDGLIYAQIQDLSEKLRAYSANPTIDNDRLVRESANALTALFRNSASKLDQLYENTKEDFYKNIDEVNQILYNIRDLDKSIREAEIHGDMALELRDERNLQIDKLSMYLDIKVEYSYENVGSGIEVEKLTIKLNNANPDASVTSDEAILVDGVFATQLSVPELKPLPNTYDTSDPKYAYLEGYPYLKAVTLSAAEIADYEAKGYELIPAGTDDNNNQLYYMGTTSVDEAEKVGNDNYTIQLGKLLNSKGVEWENSVTTWVDVTNMDNPPAKATYTYPVDFDAGAITDGILDNALKFRISNPDGSAEPFTEYTVGDINNGGPVTKADFLKFVAKKLTATGRYSDYKITSDGDNLIFTANNPGQVGLQEDVDRGAPAEPAELSVSVSDGTNSWIKLGTREEEDGFLPDDAGLTTDANGDTTNIKYVQVGDRWYRVTVETAYTREIALDDNDTRGILQAQREMLTEEGEFASEYDVAIDENALTKRGIPYYQKSLDLLAQKIAEVYNEINVGYMADKDGYYITKTGEQITLWDAEAQKRLPVSSDGLTSGQRQTLIEAGYYLKDENNNPVDKYGNPITDKDGNPITAPLSQDDYDKVILDFDKWITNDNIGGVKMGGVLFSNGNNGNATTDPPICAHNIDIAYGWSNGEWNLVPTFRMLFTEDGGLAHSTQNDNADHMLAMIDKALIYNPRDLAGSDAIGPMLFEGSFNGMLSNMMAVEASDERVTTIKLNTSATILEELDYAREGVSGVDLNDEAMNMVQYQKAMNAAMRLMTAIDEALDRLISNTGVAGR